MKEGVVKILTRKEKRIVEVFSKGFNCGRARHKKEGCIELLGSTARKKQSFFGENIGLVLFTVS